MIKEQDEEKVRKAEEFAKQMHEKQKEAVDLRKKKKKEALMKLRNEQKMMVQK